MSKLNERIKEMKTEQLNEHYSIVALFWKPDNGVKFLRQPGIFHTIQDVLNEIVRISHFNTTGKYQIVTPYSKYEVIDLFQMKLKEIKV